MAGYICIAMLEDPPYNMILAATEEEPEDWLDGLPLPSHLVCHEYFDDVQTIERDFLTKLRVQGIDARSDKAFAAKANEVMQMYLLVRDNFNHNQTSTQKTVKRNTKSKSSSSKEETSFSQGELLKALAEVLPDSVMKEIETYDVEKFGLFLKANNDAGKGKVFQAVKSVINSKRLKAEQDLAALMSDILIL